MAEITLSTRRVASACLTVPRVGAWVADVDVDSPDELSGAVTLTIDGRAWRGTVARGGVVSGSWRGRVVGGAGGLSTNLPALALRGATLGVVAAEVLREAGETPASTAGSLTAAAPRWHRIAAPASTALADVARATGYAWRVLADGTIWMGAETWATYTPTGAVDVTDERPEGGSVTLAGDVLGIVPGVTLALAGRDTLRVEQVTFLATPREVRAVVVEAGASGLGAAVDAVVRRALRRVDYLARYPARVVGSHADGSLDVHPDDARVPAAQAVPYRSLPGVTYTVPTGARVLLGYEGGDPSRPFVDLWEPTSSVTRITINGGSAKAAREGDDVTKGAAMTTWMASVSTALGILTVPSVLGTISEGSDALRLP